MTQRTWSRHRPTAPSIREELTVIAERRRGDSLRDTAAPTPRIRALAPADLSAILDMAARCSDETLRRRFHSPVTHLSLSRVVELLTSSGAASVLVAAVDRSVVGVGTLHRNEDGDGELAVLVEDDWQYAGVGHELTSGLFHSAVDVGVAAVVADVLREPRFLVDRLQRHNPSATVTVDGSVATIRMPVLSA
jgi:N-acetylglutamate synthase-like GNAT family acetyltransferase